MEDVKKNRNVTVYDICMYRSCNHGRYTTGHHLYRFPDGRKNPDLMREWVSRSGNKIRLRHWTASSIRNAGLCPDHFEAEMFQDFRRVVPNAVRKLKKNAVPIKFEKPKEAPKLSLVPVDQSPTLEFLNDENTRIDVRVDGVDLDRSSSSNNKKLGDNKEKDSRMHLFHISAEKATNDEAKIAPSIETDDFEDVKSNIEDDPPKHTDISEPSETKTQEHPGQKLTSSNSGSNNEIHRLELPFATVSNSTIESVSGPLETVILKRENETLRKDLKFAKEKCSSLQQQLQRARTSRNNYRSALQHYKHESIDDFLNRRNCMNPVARAMIKLQLHKSKVEYTPDERELVKDIFYHSISAFKYLRKAGCKMPGESTVKRWIQESDDIYDYSNYILPDNDDDEYVRADELMLDEELDGKEKT